MASTDQLGLAEWVDHGVALSVDCCDGSSALIADWSRSSSPCTHQFLGFTDQLLFVFPSQALLSLTPELDELAFFLGHGVSRLWDLSRTAAPSRLSFGRSGHLLVGRRNSSGEVQVSPSAMGCGHEKAPAEAGAIIRAMKEECL